MKWNRTYAAARAIALSLCLLTTAPLSGADISYVYDNLGRLLAVIDPATDTAVYQYDAVGNLTGITRQPSTTKTILQFTPPGGPVGTPVTIYGTVSRPPVRRGTWVRLASAVPSARAEFSVQTSTNLRSIHNFFYYPTSFCC